MNASLAMADAVGALCLWPERILTRPAGLGNYPSTFGVGRDATRPGGCLFTASYFMTVKRRQDAYRHGVIRSGEWSVKHPANLGDCGLTSLVGGLDDRSAL